METVIKVEGMMCKHCKARVEQVCKGIPGVADAVAKPTLEAALAASNVYVVGHLFLRRLEGDARLPGFREVISMRRKREYQPPASLGLPYFREER